MGLGKGPGNLHTAAAVPQPTFVLCFPRPHCVFRVRGLTMLLLTAGRDPLLLVAPRIA